MVLCLSWLGAAFATITLFNRMHWQHLKSIPANLVQIRGTRSLGERLSETLRISDVMRLELSGRAALRCSAGSRRPSSCMHLQVGCPDTKCKRAGSAHDAHRHRMHLRRVPAICFSACLANRPKRYLASSRERTLNFSPIAGSVPAYHVVRIRFRRVSHHSRINVRWLPFAVMIEFVKQPF